MKSHSDEYKETKDGAITYFEKEKNGEVIEAYQNNKDSDTKFKISVLIKQKDKNEQLFIESLNEFEELKNNVESKIEGKTKVEEKEDVNGDREVTISVEDDDTPNSESESTNSDANKDIEKEVDELKNKAEEMKKLGKQLENDNKSVNAAASSLMKDSVSSYIMLQARMDYEVALETQKMETATYMIEKNILVAKREAIILKIKLAIQKEEDVSGLSRELRNIENTITKKDEQFSNNFSTLQNYVSNTHEALKNASKEITEKVQADFRNSYKKIRNYDESGFLTKETTDLTKNLNRAVYTAEYSGDVLTNGKQNSITNETININGQVARIITTEHSGGVQSSFLDGNTEQFTTNAGNIQTITKDSDGHLIACDPELEDTLKNKLGIENVDDIDEACRAIDEKAEANELEEEEEHDMSNPSLYESDSE